MKKVLIAVSNEDFFKILQQALSPHFDVITNPLYHVKYLREFIENNKPDIIIAHDVHFGLHASDKYEREIEWLTVIENLRLEFDDTIRFAFMCERRQGDPFLSELVSRNVLDIFHHRQIDIKLMIEQLKDDPKYSRVARLVVENSKQDYQIERTIIEEQDEASANKEQDEKEKNGGKSPLQGLQRKIPSVNLKDIKSRFQIPFIKPGKKKKGDVEDDGSHDKTLEPLDNEDSLEAENVEEQKVKKQVMDEDVPKESPEEKKPHDKKSKETKESNSNKSANKDTRNKNQKEMIQQPTINHIRPKLIAVGSIHPGAGSTFLLHNFTRYLSDHGITSSILEAVNDYDALYSLYSAEQAPPDNWDSIHTIIQSGRNYGASLPKWEIEGTIIFAQKQTSQSEFSLDNIKELLFLARQAPIVFVDISHNWDDPVTKEVLRICDELWCVTDANPFYVRAMREQHKMIYQVSDRIGEDNIVVIGNRWVKGIDESLFPQIYMTIPFMKDNAKALQSRQPAYRLKPRDFAMFSLLLERLY